jgi:tetratricopeptide (TPR) repeat protein
MGKNKSKHANSPNRGNKPGQTFSIEAKFHLALDFFHNKKITEAKILLNEILLTDPRHAESWFYSALIADKERLSQDAIRLLESALEIDPQNLKYLYTIGDLFYELNYLDEGIKIFELVIKIQPENYNGYYNLAVFLCKQEKYKQSILNYHKVLEFDENNINAIYNIGNILLDTKDYNNAVQYFQKVIDVQPNSDDALNNLGFLYLELDGVENAIEYLNKALVINPNNFNALNNLGKAYEKKYLYWEALEYFEKAILLNDNFAKAYSNRGSVLNELKQYSEALLDFDKTIALDELAAEAHSNKGNTLKAMMRFEEAIASYDRAIEIKPEYAEAYSNRGVALQELKRIDEAIKCFDKAISLEPEYAEASHNKSLILLLRGDFKKGWELYKWRWSISSNPIEKFYTKIPNWDGRTDSKKIKILFLAEQGIGDEIFYFGILKNFTDINARITIAADNRLHALFKKSMPEVEFVDRMKIYAECNENSFDYQAPMGDIGLLCSVDKCLEHKLPKPFLHINKLRNSDFKNRIFNDKIVCGLSWKSNNKDIGLSKSLNLIELAPLLLTENVEFVSLQYGSTKDEIEFVEKKLGIKIHTVDDLDIYNDIDGLVSLISICDFVVTTSNITAHLTGSIGKKGMVLLPFSKGKIWYWHSGEGQSAWYPSLQLASQKQMNDWTDPIIRSKEWISEQLSSN